MKSSRFLFLRAKNYFLFFIIKHVFPIFVLKNRKPFLKTVIKQTLRFCLLPVDFYLIKVLHSLVILDAIKLIYQLEISWDPVPWDASKILFVFESWDAAVYALHSVDHLRHNTEYFWNFSLGRTWDLLKTLTRAIIITGNMITTMRGKKQERWCFHTFYLRPSFEVYLIFLMRFIYHITFYIAPQGEKHSSHRLLRSVKNRFGSTDEVVLHFQCYLLPF